MLTALLPVLLLQGTNCNDSSYHVVSPLPGPQPESVIYQPCGGGSFTVEVKFEASGDIVVLDGKAEGSITVTIQLPEQCPRSYVSLSGEFHECGPPLKGWNCDPKGDVVSVTLWESDDPCPTLPVNLGEFLSGFPGLIRAGVPVTLPCKDLKDASDRIQPSSRTRNTARVSPCPPQTEGTEQGQGAYLNTVGRSSYYVHHGDPTALDLDALVADGTVVASVAHVQGGAELAAYLASGHPANLPPILREVLAHHAPLEWFDGCLLYTSPSPRDS